MAEPARQPFPVADRWADGTPARDEFGNAPDPQALKAARGEGWAKETPEAVKLRMQLAALVGACDAIRWCYESGGEPSPNMLSIVWGEADRARSLYTLKDVRAS